MIVLCQNEVDLINLDFANAIFLDLETGHMENESLFSSYTINVQLNSGGYYTIAEYNTKERAKEVFSDLFRIWAGRGASQFIMPKG